MDSLFEYAATQHEVVTTGETPFLLQELEVFNWGPFSGRHRAVIDRVAQLHEGACGLVARFARGRL